MLEHLAGAAHEAADVYRQEVIALLLPEVRGDEAAFIGERDALEVVGQGLADDIGDGGVGDRDADSDDGVEEGGKHGAAEHGVAGEGFVAFALGGVGYDDDGEVVLLAEGADTGHDGAGGLAFLHIGTEEGDVVYDDDLEAGGGGVFHAFVDEFLGVVGTQELGAEFGEYRL